MEFWLSCVLSAACAATAVLSTKFIKKRSVKIVCTVVFSLLAAVFAVYSAAAVILVSAVD